MPELDSLKERIRTKLGIGDRQLARLVQKKEGETLLPRRLAVLALAAEHRIPISRYASEDDLSQLRAVQPKSTGLEMTANSFGSRMRTATSNAAKPPRSATLKVPAKKSQVGKKRVPRKPATTSPRPQPRQATRGKTVFVVHGRNEGRRRAMFSFLRSLNMEPLEWSKAIQATGKTNPSISEVLDAAFSRAIAVVVLLTPDDEVILAKKFHKTTDPSYEKRVVGQARPNVLFEAGMAMGKSPDATVLVQVGDVKPFSDIGGRHVTRLGNDPESRSELVTKLRNAGCAVDTDGTDWYSEGDFSEEVGDPDAS